MRYLAAALAASALTFAVACALAAKAVTRAAHRLGRHA